MNRFRRGLLTCGLIAPVVFVVVFTVVGSTRAGYSQWRNFVSQLSLGDQGWVQTANFAVSGLLIVLFAVGVRDVQLKGAHCAGVSLAIVGASLVVDGIFEADPGLGFPPGVPAPPGITVHTAIHTLAAFIAFVAIAVACYSMSKSYLGSVSHRWWKPYSIATAWVGLALWAASVVSGSLDAAEILPNAPNGVLNRMAIVVAVAWIELLAINVFRANTAGQPSSGD